MLSRDIFRISRGSGRKAAPVAARLKRPIAGRGARALEDVLRMFAPAVRS